MADYTMPDGTEVVFDLNKLSMREYRDFANGSLTNEKDDEILSRCSGVPAAKFGALPQPLYRRCVRSFFKKAQEPLADIDDPNP